jgi:hypothetical protein
VLDWIAAFGTKAKLGVGLSIFKEVQDGVETAEALQKGSQDALRTLQLLRRSTSGRPHIFVAPKCCDVLLGVPIPALSLIYTITHYESVEVVLCSASAEFSLGDLTISGLVPTNLEAIKPKKHIEVVIRRNLASSEIAAIASHARSAKPLEAKTRLQFACYRVSRLGRQRHFMYQIPWTGVIVSVTGTPSGQPSE